MVLQVAHRSDGVMRDRYRRLRSVRQPRRVAEIEIVGVGYVVEQGAKDGEAAHSGVKQSDRLPVSWSVQVGERRQTSSFRGGWTNH